MGLISRFRNLFRAKASAILDKLEDPEEQLEYVYEQLLEQRKLALRAIRDATADRNLIRNELEEMKTAMQRAHESAKAYRAKALSLQNEGAGEDQVHRYNEAAKRFLEEYLQRQQQVETLESRLEKANLSVNALREKQIDLETKLENLRAKKQQLKTEWNLAKAEERITSSLAGIESDFSDMDLTMARIEEKIKRKKAQAEASAEMVTQTLPTAPPLPTAVDTEAALAALDRELGQEPALPSSSTVYFYIAISGGGTWALPQADREQIERQLNELDNELNDLNEKGQLTQEKFEELYPKLFAIIRQRGKLVGRDLPPEELDEAYLKPDFKLPPEDLEYEEALHLLKGEGLIPG